MPYKLSTSVLNPLVLLGAAVLLLAGCSSTENFEEPDPVPEVVSTVSLEEKWSLTVGDGQDEMGDNLASVDLGTSRSAHRIESICGINAKFNTNATSKS